MLYKPKLPTLKKLYKPKFQQLQTAANAPQV